MSIYDQTPIETAICDAIRNAGVSKNVWPNRPRSSQENLGEFVVARVSGPIRPLVADGKLAECTISIALFSRNVQNMKNSKKLSVMQGKVESLPLRKDVTFGESQTGKIIFKPFSYRVLGDKDDENGYHFRLLNIQAFIQNQ